MTSPAGSHDASALHEAGRLDEALAGLLQEAEAYLRVGNSVDAAQALECLAELCADAERKQLRLREPQALSAMHQRVVTAAVAAHAALEEERIRAQLAQTAQRAYR